MRTTFALLLFALTPEAAAQTWSPAAPMPTARAGAAGTVYDGRLVVIGGSDAAGVLLATVEAFDPASGWTALADLGEARTEASAAVFDGRLVVMGGRTADGKATHKTEVYDPALDRWESLDDLGEEREGLSAVVVNGRLFVLGGADARGRLLGSVEEYEQDESDPDDFDWTLYPEWTVEPARARFGAVADGASVVIVGGFSMFGPVARAERYLLDQSATLPLPPLPEARGGLAAAAFEGAVFAAGGRDASDAVRADVDVLVGGAWQPIAALPQPREGAVAGVIGAELYVVGGEDRFGGVLASMVQLPVASVDGEGGPEAGGPSLSLAGPNPTRGATAFAVGLGIPGPVRLSVADALGREVAVLLDGTFPAGERRVPWCGDVAPGVYVARLDTPGGRAQAAVTVAR